MSYASAVIARQQILDYLNAQPTGYAPSGAEIVASANVKQAARADLKAAIECFASLAKEEEA